MEYAGAVEADPPLRVEQCGWLATTGWYAARDGRTIRPQHDARIDDLMMTLREMIVLDAGRRTYDGAVAAYDPATQELVVITVAESRVARRTVRKARHPAGSNVIDLGVHRRSPARSASGPIA